MFKSERERSIERSKKKKKKKGSLLLLLLFGLCNCCCCYLNFFFFKGFSGLSLLSSQVKGVQYFYLRVFKLD